MNHINAASAKLWTVVIKSYPVCVNAHKLLQTSSVFTQTNLIWFTAYFPVLWGEKKNDCSDYWRLKMSYSPPASSLSYWRKKQKGCGVTNPTTWLVYDLSLVFREVWSDWWTILMMMMRRKKMRMMGRVKRSLFHLQRSPDWVPKEGLLPQLVLCSDSFSA